MSKNRNGVAGTANDPVTLFEPLELDEVPASPISDKTDGKWLLFLNFNQIAIAEKLTGWNLLQGLSAFLLNTATAADYIGLLFAALQKAHPKVTTEYIGTHMVRIDLIQDIRRALIKAFNNSMPEKKRLVWDEVLPAPDEPPAIDGSQSQTESSGNSAGPSPESISGSQTDSSTI
jgi:hypothetical protein